MRFKSYVINTPPSKIVLTMPLHKKKYCIRGSVEIEQYTLYNVVLHNGNNVTYVLPYVKRSHCKLCIVIRSATRWLFQA